MYFRHLIALHIFPCCLDKDIISFCILDSEWFYTFYLDSDGSIYLLFRQRQLFTQQFLQDGLTPVINPSPKQALVFTCLQQKMSFENTVGKGEIARNKQFLLFSQCFLPVLRTFCHFHET